MMRVMDGLIMFRHLCLMILLQKIGRKMRFRWVNLRKKREFQLDWVSEFLLLLFRRGRRVVGLVLKSLTIPLLFDLSASATEYLMISYLNGGEAYLEI
ncbi:hypothetical protein WL99_20255 [Burkholderia cepacia]|nr:hypothetical protein WL99_20255 [Burkholderia cepacia]